jgi:formylmethanofuran dehydrogenase subunit D
MAIRAGDKVVVSAADGKFAVATVVKAAVTRASGLYTPMIEHPYLVVDDVVMPL